jgi:mono/diheme cytochrome c family protein
MRWKVLLMGVALVGVALGGCSPQEDEAELEAQKQQAREDSVRMAEEMFDAAVFDTLTWESDSARIARGIVVYNSSCYKCHGESGGGNGEMAMARELEVPSFLAPDWEYAGDVEALRHRVFVGYTGAMPNWGLVGLKYRDIDAVAVYLAEKISPAETTQQ